MSKAKEIQMPTQTVEPKPKTKAKSKPMSKPHADAKARFAKDQTAKKPAAVKAAKPRKRSTSPRKSRAKRPSEIKSQDVWGPVVPVAMSNDPVQEMYSYAKNICDALRPYVGKK